MDDDDNKPITLLLAPVLAVIKPFLHPIIFPDYSLDAVGWSSDEELLVVGDR